MIHDYVVYADLVIYVCISVYVCIYMYICAYVCICMYICNYTGTPIVPTDSYILEEEFKICIYVSLDL